MGRYGRIVNDFLHDMATGTWAAAVLVIWVLAGRLDGVAAEAADAIGDAMGLVFGLALAALAVIGVTGGVRLGYWRSQAGRDEVAETRRVLLVKHAAFLVVYGLGTWWAWTLLP